MTIFLFIFLSFIGIKVANEESVYYAEYYAEDLPEGFETGRSYNKLAEIRYFGLANFGQNYKEERTGRIIGGETAEPNEFPFMVRTFLRFYNGSVITWCGGVLINSKFIISAAHCFFNEVFRKTKLVAILGDHIRSIIENTEIVIPIEKCIVKDFRESTNYGDLMVCELLRNVQFNKEIQPACIPHEDYYFPIGTVVTAIGWGCLKLPAESYSDVLRKVEIRILPNFECRIRVRVFYPEAMICAGGRQKNTCPGDSGGPIFLKKNDQFLVLGLTSFGSKKLVGPVVYSRVSKYHKWITALGEKGGKICVF